MNKLNPFRSLVLASALAASALPALAYWTPLQVNLVDVAGLPPAAESVYGIRANLLYGKCDTVTPFDVGLCNRALKGAYGIRAGMFNGADTEAYGLSIGLFNSDEYNVGLAVGGFNLATDAKGVQIGAFNGANRFSGLQVGVINVAAKGLTGLQIGLLNFNLESVIPVLPIFNVGSGDGCSGK